MSIFFKKPAALIRTTACGLLRGMKAIALLCSTLPLLLCFVTLVPAQEILTSRQPDFSTSDLHFTYDDTLFVRVHAPNLDFNNMLKHQYELEAAKDDGTHKIEGDLTNLLNHYYETAISLAELPRDISSWKLGIKLKDRAKREAKRSINITISNFVQSQGDLEIQGTVADKKGDSFRLANQTIHVSEFTRVFKGEDEKHFSDLKERWLVLVDAELLDDGRIFARNIYIIRSNPPETAEVEGRIQAIGEASIFVGGLTFHISGNVEIKNPDGDKVGFSYLKAGMKVKAEGRFDRWNVLRLRELKVLDANYVNQRLLFPGRLTDIRPHTSGPESLRVDITWFELAPSASILGFKQEAISLSDLRPGEFLQMEVDTRANGIALARSIRRILPDEANLIVEGIATNVASAHVEVMGIPLAFDDFSILLDSTLSFVDTSALKAGQRLRALADLDEINALRVKRLHIVREPVNEVVVTDTIESISSTELEIGGERYTLSPGTTAFLDLIGNSLAWNDFTRGDHVKVTASRVSQTEYVAREVQLLQFLETQLAVRGVVKERHDSIVKINGYEITVADTALVYDATGNPVMNGSAVAEGDVVDMFIVNLNGRLVAQRITLDAEIDAEMILRGIIDAIDAGARKLRIWNKDILLPEQAEILDAGSGKIHLSEFAQGEEVVVRARTIRGNNSMLFGWRLQKAAASPDSIHASGPVVSAGGSVLKVGGLEFQVDGNTRFRSAEGNPFSLVDFRPNYFVEVHSYKLSSFLVATDVRLLERPVVSGRIESATEGTVSVEGIELEIAPDVLILDVQDLPSEKKQFREAQQIEAVIVQEGGTSRMTRARILRDAPSLSTSVHIEDGRVPQQFTLLQSYPNPIRIAGPGQPAQTVFGFVLNTAGIISLKIYNILGQKIYTLAENKHFAAGTHQLRWNGLTTAGIPAAPGVYFYRLQSAKQAAARRMVILP